MHKRLKNLIYNIKEIFSEKFINSVARKTQFIKRKGKITSEIFLALNTFLGKDICSKPLSLLSSRLSAKYGINISAQALNERFNTNSVKFMKKIFNEMLLKQSNIYYGNSKNLFFDRILINDSTSYSLPTQFHDEFKGSGGISSKSALKIQLQYDLLSGNFLTCDIGDVTTSDGRYVEVMNEYTRKNDLRLADLGYYSINYLKQIHDKKAFFISKIKSTTLLYFKNPNPEKNAKGKLLKSSEYIKIDIFEIIKPLAHGQTIELKDIYIGSKKHIKTRLIITKLSEENKKKRHDKLVRDTKRSRGNINNRSLAWNKVNVYITNAPEKDLATKDVHDIYSLRWQIEIMFKIWKSIFNINNVKPMKIERFLCFLYGRLISLVLSTTIVFTTKDIVYQEKVIELSELKSFYILTEFFDRLRSEIFKGYLAILRLLKVIIATIIKLGKKSRRKGKKTLNEILKTLIKDDIKQRKMVI